MRSTCIRHLAVLAVLILVAGAETSAQYFGTNKVQYERFDFRVLATDHFDIYYYPEEAAAVQLAARMAERWYARLSKVLRHELSGRQPLILYAAHPHFQQTQSLPGEIGEGTGGVTTMIKRRIVLPFAGGLAETDHVLGHELVHAFQYDIAARVDVEGRPVGAGLLMMPLWFIEGMAEYLSLGPVDAHTAMWVRDASFREKMPTVDTLDDPDFFPYRYGHAFWAYVAGRWGDEAIGDMMRAAGPTGDVETALRSVTSVDTDTFTRDWHAETRRTYAPIFETTRPAATFGRALVTKEMGGGSVNVSPALSPDGRRVVFLSERSMFSIDMYVADVASGEVTRRLVQTAGDPHFESLQFLQSAGDWAPDNRRFVFAGLSKGQPVLSIVNVDNARREDEHTFPDIDQIFNPAWSPDGRRIAFSGMTGGVLDLFLFDLESRQVTRLTNDAFADADPEWSPAGREIAWVTDRFSSDMDALEFGNYRIALMTVATRQMRPLVGFEQGRNTNPEFAADGKSLYFIAAPDGIANVYRTSIDGGAPTRVTNVLSGISGITALTPALSVAAAASGVVFTVFEDNDYALYATDKVPPAAAALQAGDRDAAALPPYGRRTGDVPRLLASPAIGLPAPAAYPERPYRARLSLDQVGQPTVGIGADRFGAYAAGGLALSFSDILGYHEVGATIQATNRFEEFGGAVGYINRTRRWNWGVIGEQTPFVTGGFAEGLATVDGQQAFVSQTLRLIQVNRGATAIAQYPFSRAQRVEFSGGMRRIGFSQRRDTQIFNAVTGSLIDERREDLPSSDPLNMAEASAALVYDTSLMGATGPILGQRYRFEYSQLVGSIMYSGVLADFRRYLMPVRPFTLAFRGVHYGRYGRDGEDGRLSPLFLGYPGMVRGYETGSFDAGECAADAFTPCPTFDRLIGSRLALASAEVRFPVWGLFSRRTFYGPLPVELALFGDAGVAWTRLDEPRFLGGDRDWVRSVGAALRFNAFGYAIAEVDYVKPLDRPGRGWLWQFNLTPAF
jgi:hypothetical protein